MILVIDIGNTSTMLGIYESGKLVNFNRIITGLSQNGSAVLTTDQIRTEISQLLKKHRNTNVSIEGAAICSVVPDLTPVYFEVTEKFFNVKGWALDHKADLGLKIDIDEPSQVGADRLANAVAVKANYGYPAVVVDLGTATNFDVVNAEGNYIGGAIAPGVLISSKELSHRASRLFSVEIEKPDRFIGANTIEAMQAGIFYGTIGMIDYMVENIIAELDVTNAHVIATGGLADKFAPYSRKIQKVDNTMTLDGVYLTYQRNR